MASRIKTDEGVDSLFKFQRQQVPQTPEEIKQFRQSYRKQLGKSCIHPKLRVDPKTMQLPSVYGKPQPPSDHYGDYFQDKFVGVEDVVNDIREQIYASNKAMPLGKTLDRKYVFPDQVQKQNFRYGATTRKDEKDAKDLIYSYVDDAKQNEQHQTNRPFLKPLSQLEAGEQFNRRYDTKYFNPDNKFGVSSLIKTDEMKKVFQSEDNQASTKIIDRRQELYQNANHIHLGMPKSSFIFKDTAKRNFLSSSTPNLNLQKLGVADCLKYKDLTLQDVMQSNIGRSIPTIGVKSVSQIDDKKIFGIPSIRTDISPPRFQSLTNQYNYGNELSASQLLNPYQYSAYGLKEEDFSKLRPREEVKKKHSLFYINSYQKQNKDKITSQCYRLQLQNWKISWNFLESLRDSRNNRIRISKFKKLFVSYVGVRLGLMILLLNIQHKLNFIVQFTFQCVLNREFYLSVNSFYFQKSKQINSYQFKVYLDILLIKFVIVNFLQFFIEQKIYNCISQKKKQKTRHNLIKCIIVQFSLFENYMNNQIKQFSKNVKDLLVIEYSNKYQTSRR
ncbi:hypothetical protein TTHERM_00340080 (macronuclear) [Tetrahymena thermophila SB210]|uniref:Uncharacterized protein n=1 Tax=Tetrahymena thermophila (strain SB210) TaxID=312017 RepID=I7MK20_TETTS|nr:hypothetical protein TTHERM_00340080 [Tetrahymena thermophila SB210]EAR97427.3 hypothetical protein TTHERM_00340080 [Tetrahymena thermophila SB210]|eukprot:XP_001017672.3 hypothetical protein TTHERM_00340080 [Tetrahymena thermophila SB210]